MGTDIHMIVQKYESGRWNDLDVKPYHDRNYDVFAILADVRNGSGFAGVDTGDGFEPIHVPRGLPDDVQARIVGTGYLDDDVWLGEHSYSWVTLAEVLAVKWDTVTRQRGVVSAAEYVAWKEAGGDKRPGNYCGGVMGAGVRMVTNVEMEAHIASGKRDQWDRYTSVEWPMTYAQCVGNFLPWAAALVEHGEPSQIRLVFGFDS